MKLVHRLIDGLTVATVTLIAITAGTVAVALAATTSGSPPADSPVPDSTTVVVDIGDEVDFTVTGAGVATVTRTVAGLELVSATTEPGWQVVVEMAAGRELELSFRSDGQRRDLNIELEDGQVMARSRTTIGNVDDVVGIESVATAPASESSSSTSSSSSSTSTTSSSTSTTSSSTSTTSTTTAPLPTGTLARDVVVLDAGSVSYAFNGSQLAIVDVSPNDGWSPSIEVSVGREVEVSFRNGEARIDLNLELEDGQIRVRIRDRRTDSRTEIRIPAAG